MKNLLYKELMLVAPAVLSCSADRRAAFIPQWPYFVAMMYFFHDDTQRVSDRPTANDIGFTVMLPVRKRDVVKARFYTVVFLSWCRLRRRRRLRRSTTRCIRRATF